MSDPILVTVELRFTTSDDPSQLAERIRESVRLIVGGDALEEFRWRGLPLSSRPRGREEP
jgi:hypothetical protein